jgi:hypothetical protein
MATMMPGTAIRFFWVTRNQDILGHPGPEPQHPLLMAGGTGIGYKGDPAAKK